MIDEKPIKTTVEELRKLNPNIKDNTIKEQTKIRIK